MTGMTKPQFLAVIGACVATLLLAVLDINIVTTTGTAIARDIDPHGGASQVPWLVALYVLVATVVQALSGQLAHSARAIAPHGGASQVRWLVAIYVLVATVVQPLYGKLADNVGVKPVYLGT